MSLADEAELFEITSGAANLKFGAKAKLPSKYVEYEKSTGFDVLFSSVQQLNPANLTLPCFVMYMFSGLIERWQSFAVLLIRNVLPP